MSRATTHARPDICRMAARQPAGRPGSTPGPVTPSIHACRICRPREHAVSEAVTVPSVSFTVVDARSVTEAAVPTLAFRLRVTAGAGDDVRAIVLSTQVRIAVARRPHDAATRVRLSELFGNQEQWSSSALSLLWTHASVTVPPFAGE